jgi:hypothetical protein
MKQRALAAEEVREKLEQDIAKLKKIITKKIKSLDQQLESTLAEKERYLTFFRKLHEFFMTSQASLA